MKKYILVAACIILNIPQKAYSNTVNTTSQSTGSVTNQAVQVVPSRQFQYQLGASQVCQGATLNISPFLSQTHSFGTPYEPYYNRKIYDTSDNYGLKDADGLDIPDGIPDNPGRVLYTEKVRTGMQQSNTSLNGGITATFSIPLDRSAVRLCKKGMAKQIELYEASLASKRLNYEMSRAKTCKTLHDDGIVFIGEIAKICADIKIITPPNIQHTHAIPSKAATPASPDKN
tara:strand:- start:1026 stop:1715 length:690 start_codon:yes stop_codon:yes gene_type:complete